MYEAGGFAQTGFNAAHSIVCDATSTKMELTIHNLFQCRTQHCMWCNAFSWMVFCAILLFQCRTQHCMWCNVWQRLTLVGLTSSFNAARSIVCGATLPMSRIPTWAFRFNAARSIVCGATTTSFANRDSKFVSMPHAALYVVQQHAFVLLLDVQRFNAARSIVCGATRSHRQQKRSIKVSMPHAALYVVQPPLSGRPSIWRHGFNAARSIVCGATSARFLWSRMQSMFQCRTQHCMWCNRRLCAGRIVSDCCFNAARSIVCGATVIVIGLSLSS